MKNTIVSLIMSVALFLTVAGSPAEAAELYGSDKSFAAMSDSLQAMWMNRCVLDMERGNFAGAEADMAASVKQSREFGDLRWTISAMVELSFIKEYRGNLEGALACLDEADSLVEEGMYHERMQLLRQRKYFCDKYGMDAERLEVLGKIERLSREAPDSDDRLTCLVLLADEALKAGHADAAARNYRAVLTEVRSNGDDEGYIDVYGVLKRLRSLSLATRDYAGAMEYSRQMLSQAVADKGDVGLEYFNVAEVYLFSGDVARCLSTVDSVTSLDRTPVAKHLMLRGMMCGRLRKWNDAVLWYERAESAAASKGKNGQEERDDIRSLLAGALYQSGDYQGSKVLYQERYGRLLAEYGPSSDATVTALYNLANIKAFCGDIDGGSRDYVEVERQLSRRIASRLRYLPLQTRGAYLKEMLEVCRNMSAFGLKAGHTADEFSEASWDALLLSKSLLLSSERSAAEIVRRSGNRRAMELYSDVVASERYISEYDDTDMPEDLEDDPVMRKLTASDAALASICAEYGDVSAFLRRDAGAVRASLGKDDVIVDMTDFRSSDGVYRYCAYVVGKDSDYADFVCLCDSSVPDAVLCDGPEYAWRNISCTQAVDFAESLASHLTPGCRVYVVPSGKFHLLPFESFPLKDGRLFGDVFKVSRLSSARDAGTDGQEAGFGRSVKTSLKKESSRRRASLWGGLDYGGATVFSGAAQDVAAAYSFLPGSEAEIDAVSGILSESGFSVSSHKWKNGTLSSVESLAGDSPDILHFATHGFWYSPSSVPSYSLSDDAAAMYRSGLVLSGGELLRASDIAALDLSGTSLAVLSSCVSAQGRLTSEGVYGLQRAFKKSGVKYVVMNLWEAGDKVSSLFMRKFYGSLSLGVSVPQAFRFARNEVREACPEPFYWAGFVLLE